MLAQLLLTVISTPSLFKMVGRCYRLTKWHEMTSWSRDHPFSSVTRHLIGLPWSHATWHPVGVAGATPPGLAMWCKDQKPNGQVTYHMTGTEGGMTGITWRPRKSTGRWRRRNKKVIPFLGRGASHWSVCAVCKWARLRQILNLCAIFFPLNRGRKGQKRRRH